MKQVVPTGMGILRCAIGGQIPATPCTDRIDRGLPAYPYTAESRQPVCIAGAEITACRRQTTATSPPLSMRRGMARPFHSESDTGNTSSSMSGTALGRMPRHSRNRPGESGSHGVPSLASGPCRFRRCAAFPDGLGAGPSPSGCDLHTGCKGWGHGLCRRLPEAEDRHCRRVSAVSRGCRVPASPPTCWAAAEVPACSRNRLS